MARRDRLRHDDTAGRNCLLNESPICEGLASVVSTLWRRRLQYFLSLPAAVQMIVETSISFDAGNYAASTCSANQGFHWRAWSVT